MRINEVDPRNFDSDIDYYNALNAKPKSRPMGEPRPSPAQQAADDEEAVSQQRQAAQAKFTKKREVQYVDQEGSAPNGQKHNKLYVIDAQDEAVARHEEYLFDKHEWGAKKVVDTKLEKNNDGSVRLTLYIVDNHKYGLWRPWKDSPAYKESAELGEKAPPGMEEWINARKNEFKARYGNKWQQVLYATAWKRKKNESAVNEFAPGSGGGESGRWYTDDEMTDLVGDGWYEDMDVSGNISKQQMIQEAQAWLDDQGYSVQVLNCKLNDDDMEWFIQGSFHNPNFAKKGVAEGSATQWEVSFDYGPHMSKTVKVKAGSKEEARAKVEKAAEKSYTRGIMINWVKPAKQGVAEGKEELHTQLQSINQKLKLMRGGPVGEPNSMAFVEKRKELLKQKEQILSQLKQGVAEGLGKSIKRGMAGWGAFDKDKPADVVKRVKDQDTDTLKGLSNRGSTGKGSPAELQQKAIERELKKRGEQGVAEGGFDDASPMTKDTVKSDRIRSLKNLIAIAKEQGRQLRVQELELELKKLQGVAEVSKATLDRYVPKAVDAHGHADFSARMSKDDPTKRSYHVDQKKTAEKRRRGISRALDRMSKMEGVAEGIDDEEYGPELAALQKEFGKFTQHYDRMDQDSAYAAQWRKQNTDRLNQQGPDDEDTGDIGAEMGQDMGDDDNVREGNLNTVAKTPQPYNEPNWAKNLSKEKLDALAGPRYKKDKKQQKKGALDLATLRAAAKTARPASDLGEGGNPVDHEWYRKQQERKDKATKRQDQQQKQIKDKKGMSEATDNPTDVICVDVPLFIRLMEYAREDASSDMDLHDVAERIIKLSGSGETVTMSSYDEIVGAQTEIKEADMDLEQGRKNIISILKASEQGQDAEIMIGGEPITLEYPEARYVGGRYKAFLKAGRQEEFLRALTDARQFDRIMAKMRAVLDKQKNFRGSVPGQRGVGEGAFHNPGQEDSPVAQAITRRILMQRTDLLAKHGPEKVGQAIDSVADFVGDVDEIGSSDVSGWVKQVERELGGVAETQVNEAGDVKGAVLDCFKQILAGAQAGDDMIDYLADELNDYYKPVRASRDPQLQKAYQHMMDNGQEAEGDPQAMAQVAQQAISMLSSVPEAAPGLVKAAAGLAVGGIAAAGAPAIVGILGPLLGIPMAAYGAYSAAKLGMKGVEKLWDMAADKLGGDDKVAQYTNSKIAQLPPEQKQAAAQVVKAVSESRQAKNPALAENQYWCNLDKKVKLIPEGYKKNKDGYLVRK